MDYFLPLGVAAAIGALAALLYFLVYKARRYDAPRPSLEADPNPKNDKRNVTTVSNPTRVENQLTIDVLGGPLNGQRFTIQGTRLSIGADPENDLCLDDNYVSGHHAVIEFKGGADWFLIDQHSLNGTFLDGRRLPDGSSHVVRPGQVVQIGLSEFRIRDEAIKDSPMPSSERSEKLNGEPAPQVLNPTRLGGGPTAVMPGVTVDLVHFSLTAPAAIRPDRSFELYIWAHLENQRAEVLKRAKEAIGDRGGDILIKPKGPVQLTRGTVLTVKLSIPGVVVQPDEETILWAGDIGTAGFVITVPRNAATGPISGCALVSANGWQVLRISFVLTFDPQSPSAGVIPTREEHHRKAFASYADADLNEVLARIQGMQKVAPNLDIFLDVLSLRSGQDWERELWSAIPASDVFYLFWSAHASKSVWVEKEWRCALGTRGLSFIDPVPLVSPKQVAPPPELAARHFNDWVIAFMRKTSGPTR